MNDKNSNIDQGLKGSADVPCSASFRVRPIVAWYDFWVGWFWDGNKRRLYILPIPCVGIVIQFPPNVLTEPRHE